MSGEALLEEAGQEAHAELLAGGENEPTVAELREYLGDSAAERSDEEITTLWKEAEVAREDGRSADGRFAKKEEAEPGVETPEGEEKPAPFTWSRPYSFLGQDGKALPEDKLKAVEELIKSAKLQTKLDGVDRQFEIDELVRLAQRSVLNERRVQSLVEQRTSVGTRAQQAEARAQQLETDIAFWDRVMADSTGELFKQAQKQYQEALLRGGGAPQQQTQSHDPQVVQQTAELTYQRAVVPILHDYTTKYEKQGVTPEALVRALDAATRALIQQEGEFLTDARVEEILRVELPHLMEAQGFRPKGASAPAVTTPAGGDPTEVAKLKRELAELKRERQKDKLARAPGAGGKRGDGSAAGARDISKARSNKDIRRLLQDPDYDFGIKE